MIQSQSKDILKSLSFDTTKFTVENVEFFPSYTPVISKKVDPPALIETKIEKPVESPPITDNKVEPIKQDKSK